MRTTANHTSGRRRRTSPVGFAAGGREAAPLPDPYSRSLRPFRFFDSRLWRKRYSVLKLVSHYGYLGHSDIASALWPKARRNATENVARQATGKLVADGYLLRMRDARRQLVFIVSPRGAAFLKSLGGDPRHGLGILLGGPHFEDRWIATRFLMEQGAMGREPYGEHALEDEWAAPIRAYELKKRFGTKLDGLVCTPEPGDRRFVKQYSGALVKVISSPLRAHAFERLLSIASKAGSWLDSLETVRLDRLVVLCRATDHRTIHALRQYLLAHPQTNGFLIVVLAHCQTDGPLIWRGSEAMDASGLLKTDESKSAGSSS
jgi:hypothetical protein